MRRSTETAGSFRTSGAACRIGRRLRRHGLIQRLPHSFRYTLTHAGPHLAFGVSPIVVRLLQPAWAALLAPSPERPPALHEVLIHLEAALADLVAASPSASLPVAHP